MSLSGSVYDYVVHDVQVLVRPPKAVFMRRAGPWIDRSLCEVVLGSARQGNTLYRRAVGGWEHNIKGEDILCHVGLKLRMVSYKPVFRKVCDRIG